MISKIQLRTPKYNSASILDTEPGFVLVGSLENQMALAFELCTFDINLLNSICFGTGIQRKITRVIQTTTITVLGGQLRRYYPGSWKTLAQFE